MSSYTDIIIPAIVLSLVVGFVFTPVGMGWNPLNGAPITVSEKYHPETVTVEGKYFSASDMKYQVLCDNNIMYSTSNIVYTNMTVNHTYIVALKTVNATLNMNGAMWGNAEKTAITTTIDYIVEEKL